MDLLQRICVVMLLVLMVPAVLSAGIWDNMNYQGVLIDSLGNRVQGPRIINFSLWEDQVAGGTPVWEEEHFIEVVDGIVNVMLGTEQPMSSLSGLSEYYLQIRVSTDSPMERIKLTMVPYALNAKGLNGYTVGSGSQQIPLNNSALNDNLNADWLDGFDA